MDSLQRVARCDPGHNGPCATDSRRALSSDFDVAAHLVPPDASHALMSFANAMGHAVQRTAGLGRKPAEVPWQRPRAL
jgi:hypothetical protein